MFPSPDADSPNVLGTARRGGRGGRGSGSGVVVWRDPALPLWAQRTSDALHSACARRTAAEAARRRKHPRHCPPRTRQRRGDAAAADGG
eukprot:gene38413-8395_t